MPQPSESRAVLEPQPASAKLFAGRRHLLLLFFITYSLAYLDRANYGFGAAAGLAGTLHITEGRSALLGGLFFLGYFAFQIPGMMAAKRFSATRLVFFALVGWGICAALTGILRQFWLLALDRMLLGIAESIIFPAMVLLNAHWFTRAERSRANTFLSLGNPVTVLWMSAITGFLIERFGWQRTFIYEGLPSILWALIWLWRIKDHPRQSSWFPAEGAQLLEAALEEEQRTLHPGSGSLALRAALFRPDVLLLSVQYFCWSLGVYGFVLWLPTIVRRGASLSMGKTGLLSAVPYVAAIAFMLLISYFSDKKQSRVAFVWPCLLISGLALLGSFLLADHTFLGAFLCLIVSAGGMYAPYGPYFAIIPERVPRQRVGEVLAMINSSGALGGFAGVYLVGSLEAITHKPNAGYLLMAISLIVSSLLLFALRPLPQAKPQPTPEPAHA